MMCVVILTQKRPNLCLLAGAVGDATIAIANVRATDAISSQGRELIIVRASYQGIVIFQTETRIRRNFQKVWQERPCRVKPPIERL